MTSDLSNLAGVNPKTLQASIEQICCIYNPGNKTHSGILDATASSQKLELSQN